VGLKVAYPGLWVAGCVKPCRDGHVSLAMRVCVFGVKGGHEGRANLLRSLSYVDGGCNECAK
jgi:hypothetical protein